MRISVPPNNSNTFPPWTHLFPLSKLPQSLRQSNQVLTQIITTTTPLPFPTLQHLFTSLIRSFTRSGRHLDSLHIFTQMSKLSLSPDLFAFPLLLKSISHLRLPALGTSTHCSITKLGFLSDTFSSTALVSMYSSLSLPDAAAQAFAEIPINNKNTVSWNAIITAFVHNRRFQDGLDRFGRMLASGFEPGEVTVVGVLSACSHLGALNQGVWVHNYVRKARLRVNVFVGTALTDMYMKCGAVDEAVRSFRGMGFKNTFSWNALISGFAMNGRGGPALEAFDAMVGERVRPDSVTFLALLCACCHQGFVDEGRRLFAAMEREFGVGRRIEHYGCMVDLLGRAGLLEEAHGLVRGMPVEPDAAVWRALLAACRIHGNVRMGERVAAKLIELEPVRGENYVLLSNLLAREKKWSEVGKVREAMSRRGIGKVPGCSSIEIDNAVYEFVVGSRSQSGSEESKEILAMLEDMKTKLGEAGYKADMEMVSYDVQEEEKENALMCHSEKLALAFALLRTSPGTAIRIVKNLRVCEDCHSFLSFASKVYERKIVVRDQKRFHHFGGGVCSCGDYW